jgi:hypothetical protein
VLNLLLKFNTQQAERQRLTLHVFVMKPASYNIHAREAGTNLNTRYNQVRNKLHHRSTSNPLQAQNSSNKLQSNSNSNPIVPHLVPAGNRYVPHFVPANYRITPIAQSEPAISHLSRREKSGVSVASSTQTNSLSDRGNSQRSGHVINNTASLRLSEKGNSECLSLASTAASDSLSDGGSAQ